MRPDMSLLRTREQRYSRSQRAGPWGGTWEAAVCCPGPGADAPRPAPPRGRTQLPRAGWSTGLEPCGSLPSDSHQRLRPGRRGAARAGAAGGPGAQGPCRAREAAASLNCDDGGTVSAARRLALGRRGSERRLRAAAFKQNTNANTRKEAKLFNRVARSRRQLPKAPQSHGLRRRAARSGRGRQRCGRAAGTPFRGPGQARAPETAAASEDTVPVWDEKAQRTDNDTNPP